jgi:CheY-like chemotaxis protein
MRAGEILIVGGNEEECVLLQAALVDAAIADRVRWAKGKDEVVALFNGEGIYADRQAFPLPQFIFVDMRERATEGFEVLWWLRRFPRLAFIPAIVITHSSFSLDLDWAYAAGATSFVVNGHDKDEFINGIKDTIRYWSAGLGSGTGRDSASA